MPKFRVSGRAKKYQSAIELERRINEYFDLCDKEKTPYTENGLGLHIGLDRHQLRHYKQDKEYYPIIRQALQIITENLERMALVNGNSAGPIFMLKNQGYSDTKQHQITGHDGKELKWIIEVVRPKEVSANSPRALAGGSNKPRLIADNTTTEQHTTPYQPQTIEPHKTRYDSQKLLPGVVNFSKLLKAN